MDLLVKTVAVIPSKTLDLVKVIAGQVRPQVDEVIIVDNTGLTMVGEVPNQQMWSNGEGMGIHEMWNEGIDHAQSELGLCRVVLLNDDVSISPRFVEELHRVFDNPDYAHVRALCGNYDNRGGPPVHFTSQICAGRYDGTGGFAGFGFMLHEEWAYGWRFDEGMKWWCGDNDLMISIHLAGYATALARDAHMVHVRGGSNTIGTPETMTDEMKLLCQADLDYFAKKWKHLIKESDL
jgi:GT2 family glycosyltransferase